MSLFGLPFFGKNKERETIELLKQDMALIYESSCMLVELFKAFNLGDEGKVSDKASVIDDLEKQVDGLRRRIEESIYSGAFLPMGRSRVFDFAEKIDDIADSVQDTAHMFGFIANDLRIPGVDGLLGELLEVTRECVLKLREAVDSIGVSDDLKSLIIEVEDIEHKADLIEENIFRVLYEGEHSTKPLILYSKLIEFVGMISNNCETASDTLSMIDLILKP